MVEQRLPKPQIRVRFPLPAPREVSLRRAILLMLGSALGYNTPKGLTSVAMASTIMPEATFPVAELLLIDQQGSMLVGSRSEFPLTIIDFWASWCGPCRISLPWYDILYKRYKADGLRVIGVSLDRNRRDALAFLQRHPVSFPTCSDSLGAYAKSVGVSVMPSSYLVSSQGGLVAAHEGFRMSDTSALEAKVIGALNEQRAANGRS